MEGPSGRLDTLKGFIEIMKSAAKAEKNEA
jgi:hypothetical protein